MKKIFDEIKKYIVEIIIIISLTIYAFSIVSKTMPNDTFFSIITGNYILENGINEIEPFTFHDNLVFIKLRWLFDIIVAIIYNKWSFCGLYILVIIVSIAITISLFESLKKLSKNQLISFFITIIVVNYLGSNLVCRAQIFSYLLFVLEMYFLESYLKNYEKKYEYFLIIDSIILVNVHSSVWLVFFLPFFTIFADKILNALKIRKFKVFKNIEDKNYNIQKILKLFFICLVTGLISPLKLSPYTYIFKVMSGISKIFIDELLPMDLLSIDTFKYILFFIFIIIMFTKTKVEFKDIILIIGFGIMAKLAIRNSFISIIFIAYPLEKIIISMLEEYDLQRIFYGMEKTIKDNFLAKIFCFVCLFFMIKDNVILNYHSFYVQYYMFPVQAVEYMKNNLNIDECRPYCHFNYGSYLEFNGIKAFLDSRSEIFCEEFSNVTILKDWYKVEFEDNNYIIDVIDKYKITHFVLYINSSLIKILDNMENAKKIYSDEGFCIYEISKVDA